MECMVYIVYLYVFIYSWVIVLKWKVLNNIANVITLVFWTMAAFAVTTATPCL